ncbi:hypothetical protein C7447_101371 [Tenacibaculum adriaticum]|uniref:Uncharacterized protein n=1 Tax=Tenacibaculum adriaticum TaxID=413713 RepID=A0A5S5DV09_9FLAO|nr:hypothetical protein [Tenacibaculum adriaticum]TYP99767.1 hypothetical protein C7447_101371 [Tenacibaculum adriaticum]
MNQKSSKKKVLTYLLFALVLFLLIFAYKKNNDYNDLKKIFAEEKTELQRELDEIIDDYKDLSVKKKDLSKRLIGEVNKIIALRDSVGKLEAFNFSLIRKYRRKIAALERQNKILFSKVDSLSTINDNLKQDNIVATEILNQKDSLASSLTKRNDDLEQTNKKLSAQISTAAQIKTTPINFEAMKERSSGKLTSTSRSSRTDAFRINFKLLKNEITAPGNKKIYVQVQDIKNNVITPKGVVTLKNDAKIEYSDEIIANYDNEELGILSLILVNRDDINEGEYKVNVFVDGIYTTSSVVKLR